MNPTEQSRISWILNHYWVGNEPISFAEYPYMFDIYKDDVVKQVIKKSAQCGGSEKLVAESMYLMAELGLTVGYYFPHQVQGNDFSQVRINGAINSSPYIKSKTVTLDNVKLKQVGNGYLYIRGTDSPDNVVSVACDCIMRDEEDLMNPDVVGLTEERLGASKYKLIRVISNPSGPGRGIDKLYNESNRMRWQIKCSHCNHWQYLKYPDSIDFDKKIVMCVKCKGEIDRLSCYPNAEWVAESPDNPVHGYHISQLINPRVSIESIIEKGKKTDESSIQIFHNMTLGEARSPQGTDFTEAMILACCQPDYAMPQSCQDNTTAGIDVGNMFNIRISQNWQGKRKAVFIGETPSENDVVAILRRFNATTIVIDAMPEKRIAKEIANQLKGKVYLAFFNDGQKDLIKLSDVDGYPSVNIARTETMDLVFNEYVEHNNILPCNIQGIPNYIPQILSNSRKTVKDKSNNDKLVWENAGADHYFLAEVYDKTAFELSLSLLSKKVAPPQRKIVLATEFLNR